VVFTLREEHRVGMFDNRVLKSIFGPWRDEERGVEKTKTRRAYYLYSILHIIWVVKSRRMRWAGHVEYMWERRHIYSVLVGKPEGKRPLGRQA